MNYCDSQFSSDKMIKAFLNRIFLCTSLKHSNIKLKHIVYVRALLHDEAIKTYSFIVRASIQQLQQLRIKTIGKRKTNSKSGITGFSKN